MRNRMVSRFGVFARMQMVDLGIGRPVLCALVDGLPTFPFRGAPPEFATTRQLAAMGLQPGNQEVQAQLLWHRGTRTAYLFRIDLAKPKRPATAAQLAALAKARDAALALRRRCPVCGEDAGYCIPVREGRCGGCVAAGRVGQYVDVVSMWGAA